MMTFGDTTLPVNNILNGLNTAQQTAVTSSSSILQILAPPGSGKTKTLTARTAYLLAHHGYKPWNVICCTFTIKASREMRERIAKLIGHELESKLILGTFHSICRRYLVSYGHLIGIPKEFGIADESDSKSIIKRIIKRFGLHIEPTVARSRISRHKARGLGASDIAAKSTKSVEYQDFLRAFEEYEIALGNSNLLDYDDLLIKCVELLRRHPSCVSNVEAVLVDEFQDTNIVQYDLMRLFAGRRNWITIVGDPDQSIYGFRSAEIKNLKRMQDHYPGTTIVNLEENYRSAGAILRCADEVIRQDLSRPTKDLRSTHCQSSCPTLRKLPSASAEALWIVLEIQRAIALTGGMLELSDFAILLRSSSLSRQIESALGKAGIPYRMVGGHRFFDRYEIKVLLDYLRAVSQPQNNDALARIINVPARKIGDVTVKALLEEAETQKLPLWTIIVDAVQGRKKPKTNLNKSHDQGLSIAVSLILNARKKVAECEGTGSPLEVLCYLIQKLSWQKHLEEKDPENHRERWANVEELIAQASDPAIAGTEDAGVDILPQLEETRMEIQNPGEEALSQFLANVALSTEVQQDENDPAKLKVTISTIHAAKGLEWPVVFIPAAYDGSIPHSRAEDHDEERRLLYVAMTRPQALLYISCPRRSSQADEICLTPFLSSQHAPALFSKQGPSFSSNLVGNIADILKRPVPNEENIVNARLTIRSVEDDVWTAEGEKVGDREWEGGGPVEENITSWGPPNKIRRVDTSSWHSRDDTSRYPVSFMSASEMNVISQATTMSRFINGSQNNAVPLKPQAARRRELIGKDNRVQGTLGSFFRRDWVQETAVAVEKSLPEPPLPPLKRSIPEEFSSHRAKTNGITVRPITTPSQGSSKPYTFLSSSPDSLKPVQNDEKVAPMGLDSRQPAASTNTRPAQTLHTTTMQQAQGMNMPGRKTYGVRRTFNGWADRMAKEPKRF